MTSSPAASAATTDDNNDVVMILDDHATMNFYVNLVNDLLQLIQEDENGQQSNKETLNGTIKSFIEKAKKKKEVQQQTASAISCHDTSSFQIHLFTNVIAERLLLLLPRQPERDDNNTTRTANNELALILVQILVQIDTTAYLPCIAASVDQIIQQEQVVSKNDDTSTTHRTIHVSNDLLSLWMKQLTHSDNVGVHLHLLNALVALCSQQIQSNTTSDNDNILKRSTAILKDIWKQALDESSSSSSSTIVAVRCATLWMELINKMMITSNQDINSYEPSIQILIHTETSESSTTLQDMFILMLNNFDDPLQQLTLLDLLTEQFGSEKNVAVLTSSITRPLQRWLSSQALVTPILHMLEDPLLSGAALQYLSQVLLKIPNTNNDVLDTILQYIQQQGVITNDETLRLQIVQALSNICQHSLQGLQQILQNQHLRLAWYDISHVSQSKLQAAILSSVALTISNTIHTSNREMIQGIMQLYQQVGPDNESSLSYNTTATTDWLLNRYVKSTIVELRIAAYTMLTSMLRLPSSMVNTILIQIEQFDTFMELIIDMKKRESTHDARIAYYDLILEFSRHVLVEDGESNNNNNNNNSIWMTIKLTNEQQIKLKEILTKRLRLGPHGRETQRWDIATE